jgi:hypothetical protein
MIKYDGIKTKSGVNYIVFSNEAGKSVDIPVEESLAKRIALYLNLISTPETVVDVINNDEPSE